MQAAQKLSGSRECAQILLDSLGLSSEAESYPYSILCQEECKNVYPLQERFAPTSTFSFLTNSLPVWTQNAPTMPFRSLNGIRIKRP